MALGCGVGELERVDSWREGSPEPTPPITCKDARRDHDIIAVSDALPPQVESVVLGLKEE